MTEQTEPGGQAELPGMPRRLFSCTPSRLTTWLDCPRRYRMTYVDRPVPPSGPPWAHNSLGASVHNALAGWWRLPRVRRTPEEAGRLLDAGWLEDGYRDPEQSARWRTRARAMVERTVAALDPDDEPVGVERTVAMRTERLALSGRIDRLDERVGRDGERELVVVDYKAGRRVPDATDARSSLALAVYALASARVLRKRARRVELHHVPTGQVAVHEHTEESLARHLRRAESIAAEADEAQRRWGGLDDAARRELVDELFPPRPGPMCAWCDLARHCPQGQAAAARRRPWDGLGDEADDTRPL